MPSRRNVIKSLSVAALSLPSISMMGEPQAAPMPQSDDPEFWSKIRSQFLLSKDKIFFNPGTVGAMPRVVVESMVSHLVHIATDVADWAYKNDNQEEYISGYNNLAGLRARIGELINADYSTIAVTDNVTNGMSYLANGLTLQKGDEVLTTDQEHPGGKSGFVMLAQRHGTVFKTAVVPKPAKNSTEIYDAIVKAITPQTKVLMVSHMISGSGAIVPVKELCAEAKKRGIFTIVDGAQTIGQIRVDVADIGCDAYAGCFHKWMGAPAGTGFLYIKKEQAKNVWTTIASAQWDNHEDEGFRFTQRGTGNFPILKGLDAALTFHNQIGSEKVYGRIKTLGKRLRDGLRKINKVKIYSPADEAACAGITVYGITGITGTQLQDEFWKRGKMRPRASGDIGVRHCTHIFNNEEEIDKALAIVADLAK